MAQNIDMSSFIAKIMATDGESSQGISNHGNDLFSPVILNKTTERLSEICESISD